MPRGTDVRTADRRLLLDEIVRDGDPPDAGRSIAGPCKNDSGEACWDNAQHELFEPTRKVEFYERYLWPIRQPPRSPVGDWIERVYNR